MRAGAVFRPVNKWTNEDVCDWVNGPEMQSLHRGDLKFSSFSAKVLAAIKEHDLIGQDVLRLTVAELTEDLHLPLIQSQAVMEVYQPPQLPPHPVSG
jgi:hypothetical protein